jgi:exopolyphosphatase / guanosine-5'-triphosphate,3'-diphosphate pyrophosphatase
VAILGGMPERGREPDRQALTPKPGTAETPGRRAPVKGFTSRISRAQRDKAAKGEARPVAVVDCGTSSVRATIAELKGDECRILEELNLPIDLTPAFTSEKLDRDAMEGVVEGFAAVAGAARTYGVTVLRAVGTSALRESANADVLVELVKTRTGVELEIIDSAEESRLYVGALRQLLGQHKLDLPGATLLVDIGGGGTSVSLIRGGKLVFSVDEHYGTVRMQRLFRDFADSTDFAVTVDRYALGAAKMMLSRLPEGRPDHLVVNGGDVRRLLDLLRPEAEGALEHLDVPALGAWYERMLPLTPRERANASNLTPFQAGLLLPAGALVRHLAQHLAHARVLVPQLTLRDGLLADLKPGSDGPHHLDAETLRAEAQQLARRYGADWAYAENTASLAVQIFDQTVELHGLGERQRVLLECSALVHDIGSYINVRNRHKHSMYLIQHSDIAGLTKIEKEMVAHIARYHRRSSPQSHHAAFQALPRRHRVVVGYLAAILRLAYGLDVERSQRIRKIRCEVAEGRLHLHVDRRQIALERWSVEGKSALFAEVFGLRVAVVAQEEK